MFDKNMFPFFGKAFSSCDRYYKADSCEDTAIAVSAFVIGGILSALISKILDTLISVRPKKIDQTVILKQYDRQAERDFLKVMP